MYGTGFAAVHCFVALVLPGFLPSLPFLPLLITSVYCGFGVVWSVFDFVACLWGTNS
jgi:hypothetical protein